jgi:hypothetical protein
MADQDTVEETVVIEADELPIVREIAAEHGVSVEEFRLRAIEPVTAVTLVLFGTSFAVSTVLFLVDKIKGGQVIDLRPSAPKTIYRSKDLLYGLVLIIALDGSISVEVKEPRGMFGEVVDALKEILMDAAQSGIDEIAGTVRSTVGDRGEVTVRPQAVEERPS